MGGRTFLVREPAFAAPVEQALTGVGGEYQMLILCVMEADGSPAFTAADVAAMGEFSKARLRPLIEAAARVCGLVGDEAKN